MSPGQVREFLDSLSPDLKERVKELVRDAMGTVQIACEPNLSTQLWCERTGAAQKFYDLCAPEVKP